MDVYAEMDRVYRAAPAPKRRLDPARLTARRRDGVSVVFTIYPLPGEAGEAFQARCVRELKVLEWRADQVGPVERPKPRPFLMEDR